MVLPANFVGGSIMSNGVALTRATGVFDVPGVRTTVEAESFRGNMPSQIEHSSMRSRKTITIPQKTVSGLQVRLWETTRPHLFICTAS